MFNQYHYLYIEDDALSREILQMIMGIAMGINTLTVFEDSYGFAARVEALPRKPDVVLVDIHVQPYNGFEMLGILRSMDAYKDTRIIAITASVMNEEIEKLRKSGFDSAIGKPLSIQTFPALLERILRGETVWHVV